MIPSVISKQVRGGVEDFLKTSFEPANPFFNGVLEEFLSDSGGIFKGPYVSLKLPFKKGSTEKKHFENIDAPFTPHAHQEVAFSRLVGDEARSTIISTGTGSGKTECFMLPILDHCLRNKDRRGVKAIVIYPMNALANDQSKRFAATINRDPALRNELTVGLYVGGDDGLDSKVMGENHVITNRDTLRLVPPDILLTNYKMLDYMLVRASDRDLWKENDVDTLRYLVVDELHTFDGAQGTDLACLVRRLKSRLRSPDGSVVCVGTSATMGAKDEASELIEFASSLFGESFDDESVVTEITQSPREFFENAEATGDEIIHPDEMERFNPDSYDDFGSYINAQNEIWFDDGDDVANDQEARLRLGEKLRGHLFLATLIETMGGGILSVDEIVQGLERVIEEFPKTPDRYKRLYAGGTPAPPGPIFVLRARMRISSINSRV